MSGYSFEDLYARAMAIFVPEDHGSIEEVRLQLGDLPEYKSLEWTKSCSVMMRIEQVACLKRWSMDWEGY